MSVPVYDNKNIVVIAGVGNKSEPYKDSDSRHLHLLLNEMWRIITRNRTNTELNLSREKLNLIATRTSAVMYQTGMNSHLFEYVHPAIKALTGYNAAELKTIGLERLIKKVEKVGGKPVELSQISTLWKEKTEMEFTMEYLVETRDKELKWLSDKSYPWINEEGQVIGSIGILMDISHLKEAEMEIIAQKNKSDQLFSNSPSAMVQLDTAGIILKVNSSFENIFGFRKTDIIGENIDYLIVPAELIPDAKYFYQETVNGIAIIDVSTRKRKDGSLIEVPIKIGKKVTGFYVMYVDLSKQKQAEKELRESKKVIEKLNETLELRVHERTTQLEHANKELEAFSYSVSHDLRAPLRHISGFIKLFLDTKTSGLTEQELGYLNTVTESSNEMGKLIDALLIFSRLNRADLKKTPLETSLLIKQGMEFFAREIETRGIEIKIGQLKETYGDLQLMRQVWTNLISNAVKYTAKKDEVIIEIGSYEEKAQTVFFIKDNGAGFDMKHADRLFGVFQRLHKSRDFEGIGIGLANVNRIITRHGGRCWAEGEVGKGAVFYFSMPVESA
jgi:PAS domain S-box-containing protein